MMVYSFEQLGLFFSNILWNQNPLGLQMKSYNLVQRTLNYIHRRDYVLGYQWLSMSTRHSYFLKVKRPDRMI